MMKLVPLVFLGVIGLALAACGGPAWTYRPGSNQSLGTADFTMGPHG
jgi:hypothetical protein